MPRRRRSSELTSPANRWLAETGGSRGPAYAERFRSLAAAGQDMNGEARLCAELAPPGSAILDAGCGTGRIAIELSRRGHQVLGVDLDASMLAEARRDAPGLTWIEADLAELSLPGARFGLVVAAGNTMVYLTPGTEPEVVRRLAAQLRPGGLLVAGFREAPFLDAEDYQRLCADAGLSLVHRWSSWQRDPYPADGYLVAVSRAPGAP